MPAQAGHKAIIQIGSTPVTIRGIKSAEVKIGTEIFDITDFGGDGWKEKLGGLSEYSLSLSGNLDTSEAKQMELQAAIITNPGALVSWTVFPKGIAAATKYFGSGLVKSESLKFAVNAQNDVSFEIDGSGAIQFTAS